MLAAGAVSNANVIDNNSFFAPLVNWVANGPLFGSGVPGGLPPTAPPPGYGLSSQQQQEAAAAAAGGKDQGGGERSNAPPAPGRDAPEEDSRASLN